MRTMMRPSALVGLLAINPLILLVSIGSAGRDRRLPGILGLVGLELTRIWGLLRSGRLAVCRYLLVVARTARFVP